MEDQPIKVDTRKALALLAYIAIHKTPHRRDTLITLLYPEYDQSRGHTNFRRTLYALRKSLAGDWLDADRETVSLKPNAEIWLDVDQFQEQIAECLSHGHTANEVCPVCISPLSAAAALYQGDFLNGFTIKDSAEFDRWQFQQTDSLRQAFINTLERLVEAYQAQNDYKTSIQYARQWQALDPLNERVHCSLMQLYDWSGQRSAVLRQYQECVKLLKEELDIKPEESTSALFQAISKGQGPPSPYDLNQSSARQKISDQSTSLATVEKIIGSGLVNLKQAKTIFVAREHELTLLKRSLDAALAGQGQPVFVVGGAGQGKTNLIQEFARRAQEYSKDLLYVGGNCNAYTGFGDPYLPFREILSLLTGDVDALWAAGAVSQEYTSRLWNAFPLAIDAIINLGPDLIETFVPGYPLARRASAYITGGLGNQVTWLPVLEKLVAQKTNKKHDPNIYQTALFEQYTKVMVALAREKPLLLVLDDLQWADNGSISLLFHLGRRLAGNRILVVCAYRPEEVATGRAGERHPLETVIHEFQRVFGEITIDLSQAEKRWFIDAYLDSEPNHLGTVFRDTLFHQTEGHPLFTVELLRGMEERGDLVQDQEGYWIEQKSLDWEVLPTRIEAVIAERVGRLGATLKEILRVACVEGEVFSAEVIAQVLSMDERKVVEQLSTHLEHRHHLVLAQEIQRLGTRRLSRYRFRHFLFQNYIYQNLDPIEHAYLHEAVGSALESLYQDATQDIALSLSRHFQEAGIIDKAVNYLLLAGEKAIRSSDNEAAISDFIRGLELLNQLPRTPERERMELQFLIALGLPLVLTRGHADQEVEITYLRAKELCDRVGDDLQQFQVLLGLRRFYLHRGDLRKASELGELLLRLVQRMPDATHISRAHMMHAEILYRLGEFSQALEYCRKGLDLYDPIQSQDQILLYGNDSGIGCRIFATMSLWHLGYPQQALTESQTFLSLIRGLSHPFTLVFGLFFNANLHLLRGETQFVKEYVDELLHISHKRGFTMYTAWGTILQGWVKTQENDIIEGILEMQRGFTVWKNMNAKLLLPNFLIMLSEAHGKAGQIEDGIRLLDQANAIMQETGERTYEAELHRCQGELLLLKGNACDEAERCFQRALQVSRAQDARSWELRAATSLSRVWLEQGKRPQAQELLGSVFNWFSEGFDTPDLHDAKAILEQLG